jgi:hypothetical protein
MDLHVKSKFSLPALVVALLPLLFVAIAGCGGGQPTGTVKGKVTFDGAPYTDASVIFLDMETGQAGSANIQAGGTFAIEKPLPVGTYTVYLAPKPVEQTAEPVPVTIDETVPDKYWNEASSDIKIEVEEGENDVAVELTG